ncbi:hypothetical protein HFZ78_24075 [Priestia megaterium]|uniref:Uncharacterized protein n=1 Tax=Priestia megaterium TaxID=1404 RepID=A0A6H1P7Z2_PRIMG|nr:hypothetical protein [Priestia megaterium]QIZ09381.1 hypothetical protein HFZ78_24075 [Priestia megaterium]
MKLPNGITGFYEKQNGPPKIDGKLFKQLCFNTIKNTGGKVLDFKEPQGGTNFFDVEVNIFNTYFHILLNAYYPFLAFASVVNFGEIKFIDEPQLHKEFSPFYSVLDTKELNGKVIIKLGSKKCIIQNENDLNSAELEQLAYWKPERIGDVIFNHWD